MPGLSVSVTVAGQVAREYNDPDSPAEVDKCTTSCYIESKSGAEFAIETRIASNFKFSGNRDRFVTRVFVDGVYAAGVVHDPKNNSSSTVSSRYSSTTSAGCVEESKFVFSPINKGSLSLIFVLLLTPQ